jgi:hypothetical protein
VYRRTGSAGRAGEAPVRVEEVVVLSEVPAPVVSERPREMRLTVGGVSDGKS